MADNYTAVIEIEAELGECLDDADAYAAAEEVIFELKELTEKIKTTTILEVEAW